MLGVVEWTMLGVVEWTMLGVVEWPTPTFSQLLLLLLPLLAIDP